MVSRVRRALIYGSMLAALGSGGYAAKQIFTRPAGHRIHISERQPLDPEILTCYDRFLQRIITTPPGDQPDISGLACATVGGQPLSATRIERIFQLNEEIEQLESTYHTRGRVPLEYLSDQRIQLSRAYRELYGLTMDRRFLDRAVEGLESLLNDPVPNVSFGSSEHAYIDKYFELRLELAETYRSIEGRRAEEACDSIIAELNDEALLAAQNIRSHSVPGYLNKARLTRGAARIALNDLSGARDDFNEVVRWASEESARSTATLWLRDENVKDLRWLEAKATIGLGRVALLERNHDQALALFNETLSMELVITVDGFMTIGQEALMYSMLTCAETSNNFDEMTALFQRALPWQRINQHHDLPVALGFPSGFPSDNPRNLWSTVLVGLRLAELNPTEEALVERLDIITRVMSELGSPGTW